MLTNFPGHVEIRLVEKLYDGVENETLMAALCTVFDQEASTDPVAGTKCEHWNLSKRFYSTTQSNSWQAGPKIYLLAILSPGTCEFKT